MRSPSGILRDASFLPASLIFVASLASVTPALQTSEQAASALSLSTAQVVHVNVDGALGIPTTATFSVDGIQHHMLLEPVTVRSAAFRLIEHRAGDVYVEVDAPASRTYRGLVPSMPGSTVAASWMDDGLHARIQSEDGQDLWLEPLQALVPGSHPAAHALYRSEDTLNLNRLCGTDTGVAPPPMVPGVGGNPHDMGGAFITKGLMVAELGVDTDFEYFQDYGSSNAVTNQIESVINSMNVQYQGSVGVTHTISTLIVRTSSNDPYSTSSPSGILNEFRNHWNSQQQSVQRDVAHMFTGKNLQGGVIGIAYLSVICNKSTGYGVVESDCCGSFASKTDLSAHELGHNWSAGHCSCNGWTMNSFLTSANKFHPNQTIPGMVNYANNKNCLDDDTGDPCTVETYGTNLGGANIGSLDSSSTPDIGSSFTWNFSGFNGSGAGKLLVTNGQGSLSFGGGTILIGNFSNPLAEFVATTTNGSGSATTTIPNNPSIQGLTVYCQAGIIDLSQAGGWAFTNGLTIKVCN